jgi:ArsR family transcriptional regulator
MTNGAIASAKAGFFKALSDETRIAIVETLRKNKWLDVGEICENLDKEQSTISYHLSYLRNCGLVRTKKERTHIFYALSSNMPRILALTDKHLKMLFESALGLEPAEVYVE